MFSLAFARSIAARTAAVRVARAPRVVAARRTLSSSAVPNFLLNAPSTKVGTLANGMRVVTEHRHGQTATVGVWINAGSAYETQKNNGAAHFLEHMAFKGTQRRTRIQLESEIENIGGHLNAYTSREQTVYYAKVFNKDVGRAVDILGDILQNSRLEQEDIERERQVILREMQEVDSQTEEVVFEHLHSIAYQGTSHGYTILGPKENITSLSRAQLSDYIKTHYAGDRMTLVAVGDVNHDELMKLASSQFGALPAKASAPAIAVEPRYTASGVNVRNDEMPLLHLAIAFKGVHWSDPDYFTVMLMQTLLGSWDRLSGGASNLSSRLAEKLATQNLANSLMTFNTPYTHTGLFGVYVTAPSDHSKTDDLCCEIMQEFNRLGQSISDAEIERAKSKLKANILMTADGTTAVAEEIGRQFLTLHRRLTPAETWMRIEAITPAHLKAAAKEKLYNNDPCVVAIGPTQHVADYNQILDWAAWRRM